MVDPKNMIKTDGTKVIISKQPSWKTELLRLPRAFIKDPQIILLFPMFFASNWFYTWRMNTILNLYPPNADIYQHRIH
jgi:hypothetical protein